VALLPRDLGFFSRISSIFLFGCALALATIASPQKVLAQQSTITICKQTNPSPDTTGTVFNFTGANGWTSPPNSFLTPSFQLENYVGRALHPNCQSFDITGRDQHNVFTETPVPPGWTLTDITCSAKTSAVSIYNSTISAPPHPAFQPGDNTVSIDQDEPNVVCTFVNSQTGSLTVTKEVRDPFPPPESIAAATSFPMTVKCTNPAGSYPLSVAGNASAVPIDLPVGSNCSVVETVPGPFTWNGEICTWQTPTYSPATAVTIVSGMNTLTVSNTVMCIKETASLVVEKIVSPDPLENGGFLSFPMTVTCTNPNHTYPLNVPGNTITAPINLPVGSTCTVAETPPQLPAGCVWLAPQYSSQPVTIAAGTNNETIINGYKCETGSLVVEKLVSPDPLENGGFLSFPMTVTCTNPVASYSLNVTGNSITAPTNLPVGSNCTFAETPPPLPEGCTWLPPQYSAQSVTIAAGTNKETIINGYKCETASLSITKVVISPDQYPFGNGSEYSTTAFPITVTCTPSGGGTISVLGNNSAALTNLVVGSTCTFAETQPLPQLPTDTTCSWLPPVYSPASVTIAAGTNNETVTNNIRCVDPSDNSLFVTKVLDPDPQKIWSTAKFPITVTCTNPNFIYTMSISVNGSLGTQSFNLAVGSECTAAETLPAPPAGCVWLPPKYSPQTVDVGPGLYGGVGLTVTNGYTCETPSTGSLSLTKTVSRDPRGIGATTNFPITVTCTNPAGSYPLSVAGNTSAAPIDLPVGSTCTFAETLPRLPPGCAWLPPQYEPRSVVIGAGANHETVTNGYRCTKPGGGTLPDGTTPPPPAGCRPPMVPGAVAGSCVCPQGTVREGETCVAREHTQPPPKACPAPMVPGAAAGSCVCPRGTVLEDGACVARQPTQQPEQQPYFGPAPGPGREGPAFPGNSGPGFGNPGAPGPGFGGPARH
jgi:hypothetical protein